jgi:hypothetical protein
LKAIGNDQTYHARVAALSITHGAALAKLLRAHGHEDHADNVEAALNEFIGIISVEVGQPVLTQAMNWVSNEAWDCEDLGSLDGVRH